MGQMGSGGKKTISLIAIFFLLFSYSHTVAIDTDESTNACLAEEDESSGNDFEDRIEQGTYSYDSFDGKDDDGWGRSDHEVDLNGNMELYAYRSANNYLSGGKGWCLVYNKYHLESGKNTTFTVSGDLNGFLLSSFECVAMVHIWMKIYKHTYSHDNPWREWDLFWETSGYIDETVEESKLIKGDEITSDDYYVAFEAFVIASGKGDMVDSKADFKTDHYHIKANVATAEQEEEPQPPEEEDVRVKWDYPKNAIYLNGREIVPFREPFMIQFLGVGFAFELEVTWGEVGHVDWTVYRNGVYYTKLQTYYPGKIYCRGDIINEFFYAKHIKANLEVSAEAFSPRGTKSFTIKRIIKVLLL